MKPSNLARLDDQLTIAIQSGETRRCIQLLDQGANANAKNERHWVPLHWAAAYGHPRICLLLLGRGADIEARDKWQITPLHRAAEHAQATTCLTFIDRGADPNAKDEDGRAPIQWAMDIGDRYVCLALIAGGAQVEPGWTCDGLQLDQISPLQACANLRLADRLARWLDDDGLQRFGDDLNSLRELALKRDPQIEFDESETVALIDAHLAKQAIQSVARPANRLSPAAQP